jgi:hypothetical protein
VIGDRGDFPILRIKEKRGHMIDVMKDTPIAATAQLPIGTANERAPRFTIV